MSAYHRQICEDPEFIQAMKEVGRPVDCMGPTEYAKYMHVGQALSIPGPVSRI